VRYSKRVGDDELGFGGREMMLLDNMETRQSREGGTSHARPWFLFGVVLVCGLLIFAHFGCHGDEDQELFGPTAGSVLRTGAKPWDNQ
jgi:hypothetical protein